MLPPLFLILNRVARSRQAFTATSAQNHSHLGTFHGHQIFRYGHFTATFQAEIDLKALNNEYIFAITYSFIHKAENR